MSDIFGLVDKCILDNFTPDLPNLRYKGPIPVFLYGAMANWKEFETVFKPRGLNLIKDYQTVDTMCDTACKFVMLRNGNRYQVSYPYDTFATVGYKDKTDLTPYTVRGRLITVSLSGLQALDNYYFNGYRANRISIPLKQKQYSKFQFAYVYSFDYSDFTDPVGDLNKKYNMSEMPTKTINGVTFYDAS